MKNYKFLVRTKSAFVALLFLWTQTIGLAGPMGIELRPLRETPLAVDIRIPNDLAIVEDMYEAPSKMDPRLVLHIQDAHGNYDAQMQIKKLLEYLSEKYAFKAVFVEGASEMPQAGYLQFFKEADRNRAVAQYLAKRGQLSGVEFFLLESQKGVEAFGIENPDLYRMNYQAFKDVYGKEHQITNFIQEAENQIDYLSSLYLGKDLRKMILEWKKFHSGMRDFLPYLKQLSQESKRILGLDLESLFAQVEWPQITRLLVMQEMEKEINRPSAEKEKDKLLQFLRTQNVAETLISGIEQMEDDFADLSDSKASEVSAPRMLLERLVQEAGPLGFQFSQYPSFGLYAGYLTLQSEIDSKILFEEIDRLFKKNLDELSSNEEEKDLLELYRDMDLLQKLLRLELTRKEWSRAAYRKDWIHPSVIIKRLDAVKSRNFRYVPSLSEEKAMPGDVMQNAFDAAFKFYDYARRREQVFFRRIKETMAQKNYEKAVLITGGFHTDGLSDLFREEEISYGVLTPRIRNLEGRDQYHATMMGTHPTLFDLSNLAAVVRLQSLAAQQRMGANAEESLVTILQSYVSAGIFKTPQEAVELFNRTVSEARLEIVQEEAAKILVSVQVQAVNGEQAMTVRDDKTGKNHIALLELTRGAEGLIFVDDFVRKGSEIADLPEINFQEPGIEVLALPVDEEEIPSETPEILNEPENPTNTAALMERPDNIPLADIKAFRPMGQSPESNVAWAAGGVFIRPTSDRLIEFANAVLTQARSESRDIQVPAIFSLEGGPGIASIVLPSDTELSVEVLTEIGEILGAPGNEFQYIIIGAPAMIPVDANESRLRRSEAEKNWEASGLDVSSITSRLKIVGGVPDTGFKRMFAKTISRTADEVHRHLMKSSKGAVLDRSEIESQYSALFASMDTQYLVDLDLSRGAVLEGDVSISLKNEIRALVVATMLLSRFNISPEKIKELTEAALERISQRNNRWGVTDNFSQFVQTVASAILKLQAEQKVSASA